MKRNSIKLLTAAILLATGQQAFAAATGTLAGQTVSNTANVSYTVSGVSQTAAFNNPAATFKVDRKVNVTVSASEPTGSPLDVAPKADDQVLTYTVTNTTNDTMDFHLATANATGDDFDVTNFSRIFVESGATPGYQSGEDTETYIDELASGDAKTVYVLSDIPDSNGTTIANGKQSGIVLTATVRLGGTASSEGGALTDDSGNADVAGTVQNVFADDDEVGDSSGLHNAADADTGFYEIQTAAISVNKTSFVMWDPINQYTNPKAIPGAVLVYCITVANPSTSVPATAIGITDVIDTSYLDIGTGITADRIAFKLSEEGVDDPTCDATTLIDSATDSSSGSAGDADYKAAASLVAKTDVDDAPDDGGYYDTGAHTVHVDTATLQAKGAGQNNVATAVFRVTIK